MMTEVNSEKKEVVLHGRNVPAIDGLRAVAILGVVLFHAFPSSCPGGFAGVDVFFVLSGYLITGNLRSAIVAGKMSLSDFYVRRIRRIVPALVVLLAAVTVLALVFFMPGDLSLYAHSLVGSAASVVNIVFYRNVNYFEPVTNTMPLLHIWTLSVEEQFYILFPLLLMATYRVARRWVPEVILVFALASLAASVIETPLYPTGSFFLLPTRAWELMAGAMLAWGRIPAIGGMMRDGLAVIGLLLIATTFWGLNEGCSWPGAWALLPVAGTAMVVQCVVSGPCVVGRALALPPFVGIGLISYSLYLWHWPLLSLRAYVMTGLPDSMPENLACIGLAFVLAWASWRWVERPFRLRSGAPPRLGRTAIFALAAITLGGLGVAGWLMIRLHGMPSRLSSDVLALDAYRYDRSAHEAFIEDAFDWSRLPKTGAAVPPTVALLGDSHAEMLFVALGEEAMRNQCGVIAYANRGVPPLYGIEHTFYPDREASRRNMDAAIDRMAADPDIAVVILAGRWASYVHGDNIAGHVRFANRPPYLHDPAGVADHGDAALLEQGLAETVKRLTAHGKRVVVVGPIPEIGFFAPVGWAEALRFGRDQRAYGVPLAAFAQRQSDVDALLSRLSGAMVVDAAQAFLDGQLYRAGGEGAVWYFDDNHLSITGSRLVVRMISERIGTWPALSADH